MCPLFPSSTFESNFACSRNNCFPFLDAIGRCEKKTCLQEDELATHIYRCQNVSGGDWLGTLEKSGGIDPQRKFWRYAVVRCGLRNDHLQATCVKITV